MARFDNLGQAIVALRSERGWTQSELALRAEVTSAMLSTYERGLRTPSLVSLGRILDALGTYPGELEERLDRLNDREAASSADPGAEGVDLERFLGYSSLSPDLVPVFAEMIGGFQSIARHVLRRLLKQRTRPG